MKQQSDLVFEVWIGTLDIFPSSFAGQTKIWLSKLASNQPALLPGLCISISVVLCPLHQTFWESLNLVWKKSGETFLRIAQFSIQHWHHFTVRPWKKCSEPGFERHKAIPEPLVKCCWSSRGSCSAAVSGFARGCVQSHSNSDTASQGGCEWTPALTPEHRILQIHWKFIYWHKPTQQF